jgi:hypothetical protein
MATMSDTSMLPTDEMISAGAAIIRRRLRNTLFEDHGVTTLRLLVRDVYLAMMESASEESRS